jgi:hypothetical protein
MKKDNIGKTRGTHTNMKKSRKVEFQHIEKW